MKVVLLDNIKGVGHVGDVKEVSDGYARNFLFQRGKAKPVTDGILKEVALIKTKKLQALELEQQQAKELSVKLAGTILELSGKANEQGTLFAGIERGDIAQAFTKVTGIQITGEAVNLSEHIKAIGEHQVAVELAEGVTVDVTVRVTAQE